MALLSTIVATVQEALAVYCPLSGPCPRWEVDAATDTFLVDLASPQDSRLRQLNKTFLVLLLSSNF